jgi:protein phosphatase
VTNAPREACRLLIDAARAGGGHDNISVGVFVVDRDRSNASVDQAATKIVKIAEAGAATAKINAN